MVSRRRAFRAWAWGFYALMMLWGLALAGWMDGYLQREDRRAFLLANETLLRQSATHFSDALTAGDALLPRAYVRRLAGEKNGRYAILMNRGGEPVASSGRLPSELWEPLLSRAALKADGFRATEVPGPWPFLEGAQPLFVRGKKWGVLRWGVWTDPLRERRRPRRLRLLFTWGVAALAGGVLTSFYLRKTA